MILYQRIDFLKDLGFGPKMIVNGTLLILYFSFFPKDLFDKPAPWDEFMCGSNSARSIRVQNIRETLFA